MSQHDVEVIVAFKISIDTAYAESYPDNIVAGLHGERLAVAMARFDVEHGDEPADIYATDQYVFSAGPWRDRPSS